MEWLKSYSASAAATDRFVGQSNHFLLLASGLFGEAGSVVAEVKKMEREGTAYPAYRHRITEELGDCLWYFVRIATVYCDDVIESPPEPATLGEGHFTRLRLSLSLGACVGDVLHCAIADDRTHLRNCLVATWAALSSVAHASAVSLSDVASANVTKIENRWPSVRRFIAPFDDDSEAVEQLPRALTIEFIERKRGDRVEVILRCNALNIGDRITDNISDPDGYRFHDVFHIAYVAFLGWSPVIRSLLRCKRKSVPKTDENEDGARAQILEEAISAIVFSRAKNMGFFEGASGVDYDLLKSIREFVEGYEVERAPVWQWEQAILQGYQAFRLLREHHGGRISWDLLQHTVRWQPPSTD